MTLGGFTTGDQFAPRTFGPVDLAWVRRYAAASGDDNPIHVDAASARAIGLPGPIVQGMLLMGLADTALAGWLPGARCDKLSTRFALPVAVGETVSIAARVVRADIAEDRPRLTLRIFLRDGADKVVTLAEAIVSEPA